MDIKDLRCFLAVAEKLNFSRAAESLYMSQPALSLRINSMEEDLGVPLFSRTHQKVYLTPAGAVLLPEIQEILDRFDALPAMARDSAQFTASEKGKISVALDDFLPEAVLSMLAARFSGFYEKYPNITLDIDTITHGNYQSVLINRDFDICFMGLNESHHNQLPARFSSIVLDRDEMVMAYVGHEEKADQSLLQKRELLLVEGDSWNSIILNYLNMKNISAKIRMLKAGSSLCISLMQKNTVTYMPIPFFRSLDIPDLHYRPIDVPEATVITSLIWDRSNFNPALQLLINCFDV